MRALTLAEHAGFLTAAGLNPDLTPASMSVDARLRPTELSREYRVTVVCRPNRPPRTYLRHPYPPEAARAPHLYASDTGGTFADLPVLCLFDRFWFPEAPLTETILPWAAEWLHYYEIWRATDDWIGGGAPSKRNSASTLSRRRRRQAGL